MYYWVKKKDCQRVQYHIVYVKLQASNRRQKRQIGKDSLQNAKAYPFLLGFLS